MITEKVFRKIRKAHRRLRKVCLRPVSVYLFHQVSDVFDEGTMEGGDWSETEQFKRNILKLMEEFIFIPLDEAYHRMGSDYIRRRKYAALTSDDGWKSLKNALPWLEEKKIPVTLFLNPGYFDGKHYREKSTEKYLLREDIAALDGKSPSVTFGLHGWDHTDAMKQSAEEFRESVKISYEELSKYKSFIPYFAYTYGSFDDEREAVLKEFGLVPVLIDGEKNVDDVRWIHRELLDGKTL